jgi:hypothetical protein
MMKASYGMSPWSLVIASSMAAAALVFVATRPCSGGPAAGHR